MMPTQQEKFELFRDLHRREETFVVPNPWDTGSARLLSTMGFEALATTSAGYAFSAGIRDSLTGLSRDEVLHNAARIVQATHLPVTADLQDGFGPGPETCAGTIRLAAQAGLVGGSIEDATGDPSAPVYDLPQAVERVRAAVEAARDQPFLVTARAENHLFGLHDLAETITRLQAFSAAGADVLYAPGLPNLKAIRTVCESVDKPVNVVIGLTGPAYSVAELAEAGVRRISLGGSLARTAFGALARAAREIVANGTFTFTEGALPGSDITAIMRQENLDTRL